jgi:shikimate dehydrogenase
MKRAGVIGWPVAHSLSPVLHGHWLKQYGIDGAYEKIPATPEDFVSTIARLRAEGFSGVNCTVPHKQAAFALADVNDGAAEMTGATNLLVFAEDGIHGHNTDFYGLMESLRENIGPLTDKTAILLGAGGAARGALLALEMLGAATIHLLNRDAARAEALAAALTPQMPDMEILPGALADWSDVAFDAALVVNSTSAGMGSNPPLDLDLSLLLPDAAVCDIVYHPLETQLLKDAAARGLLTIDGLGMLMHQAAPSFEAFFGVKPKVTPGLRQALVKVLRERQS